MENGRCGNHSGCSFGFRGETPVSDGNLFRLSAFADGDSGGNPAGVWIGDELPSPDDMLAIAADVGYSETAFVAPRDGSRRKVRYYSPEAEVSFCGHATVATGVVLGRLHGPGTWQLDTAVGEVPVAVADHGGQLEASLRSVDTRHAPVADALLEELLASLRWSRRYLDPSVPVANAWAGAWHTIIAVHDAGRLAALDYDFAALKATMLREQLTTLQLVRRESDALWHSRNPFPVGGVVEDPATGAAAAAFGGYLRDSGLRRAPFEFHIRQGVAMGRPSRLRVQVPASGGVTVAGVAIDI